MKKKALISACLIGVDCKYSGGNNLISEEKLEKLKSEYELIPVCPEVFGGLPTPRTPAERVGDKVISKDGKDVTAEYEKGAAAAELLAKTFDAQIAFLKENSPSCGSGKIYDGTFSGTLTDGDGVTAEKLKKNGITVIGESKI